MRREETHKGTCWLNVTRLDTHFRDSLQQKGFGNANSTMRKDRLEHDKSHAQFKSNFGGDALAELRKFLVWRCILVSRLEGKILHKFLRYSGPETRKNKNPSDQIGNDGYLSSMGHTFCTASAKLSVIWQISKGGLGEGKYRDARRSSNMLRSVPLCNATLRFTTKEKPSRLLIRIQSSWLDIVCNKPFYSIYLFIVVGFGNSR
jgi:hypothetical protein